MKELRVLTKAIDFLRNDPDDVDLLIEVLADLEDLLVDTEARLEEKQGRDEWTNQ